MAPKSRRPRPRRSCRPAVAGCIYMSVSISMIFASIGIHGVPASRHSPRLKGGAEARLPHILQTKGVPVKIFCDPSEVEPSALQQLKTVAESGLVTGHVAAMPDVHLGKGATVGSVFASDKWVAPNAVGVDIGCGMAAVPIKGLHRSELTDDMCKAIRAKIKARIPTGFSEHKDPLKGADDFIQKSIRTTPHGSPCSNWLIESLTVKHIKQLGTLGGGNHFLEVLYDDGDDNIWIMLHSGSRNIGNICAQYWDNVAKGQTLPPSGMVFNPSTDRKVISRELAFLRIPCEAGQAYLSDMRWCQRYAEENRRRMLEIMVKIVQEVTGHQADFKHAVNIHHNYCSPIEFSDRLIDMHV
ncbi:hypothetical protein AAMO2058_001106800 [Amorphochlora amoebiformis]